MTFQAVLSDAGAFTPLSLLTHPENMVSTAQDCGVSGEDSDSRGGGTVH